MDVEFSFHIAVDKFLVFWHSEILSNDPNKVLNTFKSSHSGASDCGEQSKPKSENLHLDPYCDVNDS